MATSTSTISTAIVAAPGAEHDAGHHHAERLRCDRHRNEAERDRRQNAESDDDRGKQGRENEVAGAHDGSVFNMC
jgi:hypothetical protein